MKALEESVFGPCTLRRTWGTRPEPTTVVGSSNPARAHRLNLDNSEVQSSLLGSPLGTVVLTQTLNHPNLDKEGEWKTNNCQCSYRGLFRGEERNGAEAEARDGGGAGVRTHLEGAEDLGRRGGLVTEPEDEDTGQDLFG